MPLRGIDAVVARMNEDADLVLIDAIATASMHLASCGWKVDRKPARRDATQ
jgi:hypothetical protein